MTYNEDRREYFTPILSHTHQWVYLKKSHFLLIKMAYGSINYNGIIDKYTSMNFTSELVTSRTKALFRMSFITNIVGVGV